MPETTYILSAILISILVTWALRALPFAFLAPLRRSSMLPFLNDYMPPGLMLILVFYTVRDTPLGLNSVSLAVLVGLSVTALLHLWRKNATLSVVGGTAAHVALASALSF